MPRGDIEVVVKALNEKYGAGTVMTLGEKVPSPPRVPHGNLALDQITYGGCPTGTIQEWYGAPESGKTTSALHLAKQVCNRGGLVTYVGIEPLSLDWAENLGVPVQDVKRFKYVQPDSAEAAFDSANEMAKVSDLVIVDSIAAGAPQAEADAGPAGGWLPGLQPRLVGRFLRILQSTMNAQRRAGGLVVTVVLLNQIRYKIGVMFGNPETVPGGMMIKHAAQLRFAFRTSEKTEKQEKVGQTTQSYVVGRRIVVRCVKSKVCSPFLAGGFYMQTRDEPSVKAGWINNTAILRWLLLERGFLVQSGNWFTGQNTGIIDGEKFNGRSGVEEVIDKNYEVFEGLIRKSWGCDLVEVPDGFA